MWCASPISSQLHAQWLYVGSFETGRGRSIYLGNQQVLSIRAWFRVEAERVFSLIKNLYEGEKFNNKPHIRFNGNKSIRKRADWDVAPFVKSWLNMPTDLKLEKNPEKHYEENNGLHGITLTADKENCEFLFVSCVLCILYTGKPIINTCGHVYLHTFFQTAGC